jgi:predicted Kef-type K+ transport protein
MIGITLVEDVALICMTVVLPTLRGAGDNRFGKAAWTLGKAFVLLVSLVFFPIKVIPQLLRRVKLTCSSEPRTGHNLRLAAPSGRALLSARTAVEFQIIIPGAARMPGPP